MSTYFSEIDYDGDASSNFVEIVVPVGVDTSSYTFVIYDKNGTVQDTFSFGSPSNTISGQNVFLFDSSTPGWPDILSSDGLAIVDGNGGVVQFVTPKKSFLATEGPANGQNPTVIGEHSDGQQSLVTSDEGNGYGGTSESSPGTIPCYAPGTMIDTPDGPRAVELLRAGDLVMTLDHGPQAIRWARSGDHPLEDTDDDAKPVQIKAGALGRNLPAQDLIVSPQHRILVGGAGQLQQVFTTEAFAPAKSLTAVPGIRHMMGKSQITWIHFACDRHEVVTANGCLSESLLLGPMVVNRLLSHELKALTDIFGPAQTPDTALNGQPARECLTVGDVRRKLKKVSEKKVNRTASLSRKWDVDLAMEQHEAKRLRGTTTDGDAPFAPLTQNSYSSDTATKTKLITIRECSEVFQQGGDFSDACKRVIEILSGKLRYQRSAIILKRQSDGRPLIFAHCQGLLSDKEFSQDVAKVNRLIETKTNGVVHSVLNCANPIIVNNVANHDGYISADDTMLSEACFPLIFNGECIGAFNVESDQKNAFDEDDAAVMIGISAQIAMRLKLARLQQSNGITDQLEKLST